jgi:hypothetical protein
MSRSRKRQAIKTPDETKRARRVDRPKEGKKVPPLRAERRVTTYTRFRDAEKVRVCISAERMWLPRASILQNGGADTAMQACGHLPQWNTA